ncbi:MAG: phosphate ABC transporter ATP-binding protein [Planctomycetes bacterium]|nr:phosphate ABC transporter ATP-binding protein [Planctomycetota bacterium]
MTPHEVGADPVTDQIPAIADIKVQLRNFGFAYGSNQVLKDLNVAFENKKVTALIGPSGCGKTTLLRSFNRMHDLYPGNRYTGEILLLPDRINLVAPDVSPTEMRMRLSMVFQKPNPFPKSIFENVAFGLRMRGVRDKARIREKVEQSLRDAALWDETKDRLHKPAYDLSGGQQQRLCIARALAVDPEIVLFDEPTSALDPTATLRIEELIDSLRNRVTIIIVTHNMQQAQRIADWTGFLYLGSMVEFDRTEKVFTNPGNKLTEQYITGRFG